MFFEGGKFIKNQFQITFRRLPWNCTTPFGYFNEFLLNTIAGQSYIFTNGVLVLLFISMCWHHQAFFRMYHRSLIEFEHEEENRNDKRFLCDLIQFQNMAKEYVFSRSLSSHREIPCTV